MLKKLNALLKLDEKATEEQALAAVAALQTKVADLETAKQQASADEKLIAEKQARGLTREQAIAVIQRQRAFDAAQPKAPKVKPSAK